MSASARSVGCVRGKAKGPSVALSQIEETLALHIRVNGIAVPHREYKFDPERKWRIDFAWPDRKLAVECEGHVHRIRARFERDAEKYNALAIAGWTLLRFTGSMVRSGIAVLQIAEALDR